MSAGTPGAADADALFGDVTDPETRRRIVERYDRLAVGLARRYRGRGESVEDLIQVARLALLKAIDRFDADRGVQFTTFATRTIVGELKRHLRDRAWSVRVPRSLQERWLETSRAVEELTQRLGRSPDISEIASTIGASSEEVLEAIDAGSAYSAASLDAPAVSEEGAAPIGHLLPSVDTFLEGAADRTTVSAAIKQLPDRSKAILHMRFFEAMSQREIAEQLGISQMHVSRLLRQTLQQLREEIDPGPG